MRIFRNQKGGDPERKELRQMASKSELIEENEELREGLADLKDQIDQLLGEDSEDEENE